MRERKEMLVSLAKMEDVDHLEVLATLDHPAPLDLLDNQEHLVQLV